MRYWRGLFTLGVFFLTACGGGGGGGDTAAPPANNNQPPSFTGATSFTFAENEAVSFTLTVTDPDSATITITDDAVGDGALFVLDASSGTVTANTATGAFDFENPQDTDSDNVYEQNITLSDGTNTVTETITVTITDVDEAPVFTNATQLPLNENQTGVVITYTAVDPEGAAVSDYTISQVEKLGEVVNAQRLLDAFSINPVSGELSVVIPFDAEVEGTQDAIRVTVEASDGNLVGSSTVAIQLVDLPGQVVDGIRYTGVDSISPLGAFTETVGDIDQDGLQDLWIAERPGGDGQEAAYLVWGSTIRDELIDGAGDLSIADLSAGQFIRFTNDTLLNVERRSIIVATGAGDVDGDGVPDLLVGLDEQRDTLDDVPDGPLAFVVWGSQIAANTSGEIALQTLAAADGIRLEGVSRMENRQLSMAAGDYDGDGRSDLLFGSPQKNRARIIFGDALNPGTAAFDIGTATASQALLVQSVNTTFNVIQQIGAHVATGADWDGDGRSDLVITGQGLEPTLQDGVYVLSSQVVVDTKGVSSEINLLDPANLDSVLEMLGQDAAITDVSVGGDVDNDGLDDLAIGHLGNFNVPLVATLLYATTLSDAFTNGTDPSLVIAAASQGVNVEVTGQGFTQTLGAEISVDIVANQSASPGAELMIGLADDSPLNRDSAGSITLLDDAAITTSPSPVVSYAFDTFPDTLGRQLQGLAANSRVGGNVFMADVDGDGIEDLCTASTTAGIPEGAGTTGAFYLLPGTVLSTVFGDSAATYDLARSLDNETPPM